MCLKDLVRVVGIAPRDVVAAHQSHILQDSMHPGSADDPSEVTSEAIFTLDLHLTLTVHSPSMYDFEFQVG